MATCNDYRSSALASTMHLPATGFIVTVYGDVVVPRGEVLWMGSLIEVCARVGISENLVRTAVSRLVASDRLIGERRGRRSFYRLAPTARAEFTAAAQRLYNAGARPDGWMLLIADETPEETRRRFHLAPVGGNCWLAPDWAEMPPGAKLVLRVADDNPAAMPGLASFWDLQAPAGRYDAFLRQFAPVAEALEDLPPLQPAEALSLRLLLVHAYRGALLRDPLLPESLLPQDWSGTSARKLFCRLYRHLTPVAQAAIAELEEEDGFLPAETVESRSRITGLSCD